MNDYTINMTIADARWDAFVTESETGHFLQQSAWGHFRSRWGWRAARIGLESAGQLVGAAQLLFRSLPAGRSFAYIPRGPVLQDPDDAQLLVELLDAVHDYCRSQGALLLAVEPNWACESLQKSHPPEAGLADRLVPRLEALGFREGVTDVQPSATLMVDLRPSEEEILAQMHSKWRYNIRLSGRKGVGVRVGDRRDFATYHRLSETTGDRNEFGTRPEGYYEEAWAAYQPHSRLFIAKYEDDPLAAIIVVKSGKMATYLYGASSNEERNRMPNHALQWAAMQWAKAEGCDWYDFWGIPPEIPLDGEVDEYGEGGLWGVFRFKQGFGGQVVKYPGPLDHPYSRLGYFLYEQYIARRGGA